MLNRIFILLPLLLGLSLNGWAAPPSCMDKPNHPKCSDDNGGGNSSETKYTVEMLAGTVGGLVTTEACDGLNKGSKLHAVFPGDFGLNPDRVGCAEFTIDDDGPYDTAVLHLGEIAVTQQNTRVILFFTSDMDQRQFPGNETGFQTLRLDATPTSDTNTGVITLWVNEQTVKLTKSHRPDKGLEVGTIAVGAFRYTPAED